VRIAYITAGAAGMYCGSCMHDNTLVTALQTQGHDALLIPTYTPITTDEPSVSQRRVFFGGINVYLQQKLALFRHTPWTIDRLLDAPRLLRWVSRFAVKTKAEELGDLTISMLQGEHGFQRKEIEKLVTWLAEEIRPEVVCLTNALLSGMVHELKRRLKVPVFVTLQGDDIFLEALPESDKTRAIALIAEHCREIEGFIVTSRYYAEFMAGYFGIKRERIHVIYPGLNLAGHGGPIPARESGQPVIGYFARICPEKGLHHLVEAFRILRQTPGALGCRLHVSGWLGPHNRAYFDDLRNRLAQWNLAEDFKHVESPDHQSKVRFLQGIDVLSVPTVYREPKGLYVLEAMANGVPVVQPDHGSFPELIEATNGGHLVKPDDPVDLARGLRAVLEDHAYRVELGRKGKEAVHQRFTATRMAEETARVLSEHVRSNNQPDALARDSLASASGQ
jgi:glycosyltransferase involved in cell wall biosynthesis